MAAVNPKELKVVNKNTAYLDLDKQYVNPVLDRYFPIVAKKAQGSYIYDLNGDRYLDFTCGIAVTNIGHCHPKVVQAVQKQVAELMHTSVVTHHQPYIDLAQKIAEISPPNLNSVFFANSGAEAVEGALKLARYTTGRPAWINFRGSFHGRTMMATALTSSKLYLRELYEPLPGPIFTSIFPYQHRSEYKNDPQGCLDESIAYLENLFHQAVHPKQVAAMIVEPIQGEGGYIVPPPGFLTHLRKIADKHGIMLILDEVQSGFGRTGKMFACEHEAGEPDILLMAKGIASGLPLSAFVCNTDLSSKWKPGRHGSTFGGNPVSCAASLATIQVIKEEKLLERSTRLGQEILSRLQKFAEGKQHIGEIRGKGMMIGIEFDDPKGGFGTSVAKHVVERCFEQKLLLLRCGSFNQVIRVIPPLNISDSEAEKACEILEKSMTL